MSYISEKYFQLMNHKKIINGIISDHFDIPELLINDNTSIKDDLQADSLTIVELIMAIEDSTGVKIPDEQSDTIKTVGDIYSTVESIAASKVS